MAAAGTSSHPLRLAALVACAVTLVVALLGSPPAGAQLLPAGLLATVVDADGDEIGTVGFVPDGDDGSVLVDVDLAGLPPGFHGFHVHAQGTCDPGAPDGPFTTAGGHYGHADPAETPHGGHDGDLPVLYVQADGTARQQMRTTRFAVEDVRDRAIIVHANPDNYANIPDRYATEAGPGPDAMTRTVGDAGGRIACGVIAGEVDEAGDLPAGDDTRSTVLVTQTGGPTGVVSFTGVEGGVLVEAEVDGLPEGGFHGFHLHVGPRCTDPAGRIDFTAAQGHWNPDEAAHRDHAGDLPVLLAGGDGGARLRVVTDRLDLDDLDGRAVIVHASPDNYANIPGRYSSDADGAPDSGPDAATLATGDAGGRLACGLVDGTALRLSGQDRFGTAVAISQAAWRQDEAEAAVLARADRFADGLAGTPLAAAMGGPLLLSPSGALHPATATELSRVLPAGATVYLLGGEAALSSAVEDAVAALGFEPERIAGPTRIETAIAIATEIGDPDTLLITTGYRFPDALSAGAAAAEVQGAVLLTTAERPHPALDAFLARQGDADVVAVGGPAARAYPRAEAVLGADRRETAVAVAERFFPAPGPLAVGVARQGGVGDDRDPSFADALAGGAHAATLGSPVLLTSTDALDPVVADHVAAQASFLGYLYGGTAALAPQVFTDLQAALAAGPGGG